MSLTRTVAPLFLGFALATGNLAAATPAAPLPTVPSTTVASAHEVGQSYLFLRIYEDSILVRVEMTTSDVEAGFGFGWDPEAGVSLAQVEAQLDSIRGYVESRLAMSADGQPLDLQFRSVDVRFLEVADFVMLFYAIENTTQIPDEVSATFPVLFEIDDQHRNFLIIEHNWKTGTFNSEAIAGVFSPNNPTQTLDLTESTTWRGFVAMVWQGIWHIWIGLDHILFLVALILPAVLYRKDGEWKTVESFRGALWNIVKIVTFFTIAHSVTLALAALDIVQLPSRFVESIIAGSIAVAAWANLMPKLSVKESAIAFAFGFFHGFGFASVLSDIGLGREHLVLSLLGFNIGVELGQIAIICAVFPILFLLRKTRLYPWILRYGSLALISLALLWVVERVFDVNVPLVPLLRSVFGG